MNIEEVLQYFQSKGYPEHVAAGIAGNLGQESSLNPDAINPKSGAFGLAQWLGPRKESLQQFAQQQGSYASDPGTQLDFIHHELNTTEKRARDALMKAQTPAEAAVTFSNKFERAGVNERNNERRVSLAEKAMNFLIPTASADETPYTNEELAKIAGVTLINDEQPTQPVDEPTYTNEELAAIAGVKLLPDEPIQQDSVLAHKAKVGARGVMEGLASIPGELYSASQYIPQELAKLIEEQTGFRHPILDSGLALPAKIDTQQIGSGAAGMLGLDKPTENDNIVYPVGKAIGGYVLPAVGLAKFGSPALKAAGAMLGGNAPMTSIAGIVGGKTAAEVAREQGARPGLQMAADILGNIAGGGAVGVANAVGRTAARAGKAATGTGLEGVAGRTLNRAAGVESPQVIEALATGQVPTIARSIPGYAPTASEIAGNPGLSTIMRQTGLDVDSLSQLGARKFQNAQAIEGYANKAVGSSVKRSAMEERGFAAIDEIAQPMRERNLPVDLTPVRSAIDEAMARHAGNKNIIKPLDALKRSMPQGETVGFNEAYNFKQYIDEMLRGNPLADPKAASMQRAASALKDVKRNLAGTLTATEPGFSDYLKFQATNLSKIGQRDLAKKIVESSRVSNPLVSNLEGQAEVFPMSPFKLSNTLKNDKTLKTLSPAQLRVLKTAEQHARLPARSNLGLMNGSSTAQNLSVKDAVFNDLMAAGFGEKPSIISKAANATVGLSSSLLNPFIGKKAFENSAALAKILTKAELEPKYAAELMKTYGLGHMNFNDNAGRAALRAILTRQNQ